MNQVLLTLPLRRKRDLLLARQRARQIASLLGFDPERRASIAASVFEITGEVFGSPSACVRFTLSGNSLQVAVEPRSPLRLDVPLPLAADRLDRNDLIWAVQALSDNAPLDILEEVSQQNQELLQVLQELHAAQRELVCLRGLGLRTAAA